MDIIFISKRLEKEFNSESKLRKKHGPRRTKKIKQRMTALKAADVLSDMDSFPGRCHQLVGDRKEQWSLDLDHPYRLIFSPANDPIPTLPDGGIDKTKITSVCIIGVVDTHE
jgi:proteic killer suppression protein